MTTGDHLTALLAAADEEFVEAGFCTGDFARVRELLAEALAGTEQAGDLAGRARALDLLGMVAHYDNITKLMSGHRVLAEEIDAEERLFRQALAAWHAVGQRPATAQALFGLGLVYQVLHSDWTSAMPYFWQALELADANDAGTGLYLRSEVHRHVGFYFLAADEQPAEAVRHLQLSLDLREQLGDRAASLPDKSRWRRQSWPLATATGRSSCCAPLSCNPGRPGCWLSGSRTPSAPCGTRKRPSQIPALRTWTLPADLTAMRSASCLTAPRAVPPIEGREAEMPYSPVPGSRGRRRRTAGR